MGSIHGENQKLKRGAVIQTGDPKPVILLDANANIVVQGCKSDKKIGGSLGGSRRVVPPREEGHFLCVLWVRIVSATGSLVGMFKSDHNHDSIH